MLFNALLEHIFRQVQPHWVQNKYGLKLGHTELSIITGLRFADDVLAISTSLTSLTAMLSDIERESRKQGLELHPDKTKIMSNTSRRRGRTASTTACVNTMQVEILPYSGVNKYLGRNVSFDKPHETEINARVAAAWRKFMANKDELTNAKYSLNRRLGLFESIVGATMLYGCASWTLTKKLESQIQRTQRKML